MNIIDMHFLLEWIAQHVYCAGADGSVHSRHSHHVGIGGLVSTGAMNLWIALVWAAAGAIVGDGISYWLGHRYRE